MLPRLPASSSPVWLTCLVSGSPNILAIVKINAPIHKHAAVPLQQEYFLSDLIAGGLRLTDFCNKPLIPSLLCCQQER